MTARAAFVLLIDAARAFAIPLVFVSTPHQTVFQGAYVQGHYTSKDAYSVRVRNRRSANRQIEDLCCQLGAHYIDIQSFADGLDGMFYDDIHLTGLGAGRGGQQRHWSSADSPRRSETRA